MRRLAMLGGEDEIVIEFIDGADGRGFQASA